MLSSQPTGQNPGVTSLSAFRQRMMRSVYLLVLILNLSAAANAAPVFFKYNLIPVICILERVMKFVGGFSATEGLHLVTSLVMVQEQIFLIDIIIDYKKIQIPNLASLLAKHFYTVC